MRSTRRVAVRPLGQIKGVVLLARGMLGRDVERGEVVEIVFDMRPFGDDKAHLAKDRDDLVDGLADRVNAPLAGKRHRQGDVGVLGGEPLFERLPAEPRPRLGERRRDPVLGGVQFGAGAAPRLRIEDPEFPHRQGQAAPPAQHLDPGLLQRFGRCRSSDFGQDPGALRMEL